MRLGHQQDTRLWFDGQRIGLSMKQAHNESQLSTNLDNDQRQPIAVVEMKLEAAQSDNESELFKTTGKDEQDAIESRLSPFSNNNSNESRSQKMTSQQMENSKSSSKIQLISHNHLTIGQPIKKPVSPTKFTCNQCTKPISDRYIMKVFSSRDHQQVDENCLLFHENCLKCSICDCLLEKSCFIRDSKLLCARDYSSIQRLAGQTMASEFKCIACCQPISPLELVMRVNSNTSIYHLACFTCFLCSRTLNRGDRYLVLDNGRVLCTMHQPHLQRVSSSPQLNNHLQQYSISQYQCESIAPNFNSGSQFQYQQTFSVIQQQQQQQQKGTSLEVGQSLLTAPDPTTSPQVFARSAFGQQRHSPLLSLSGVVESVSAQEAKKTQKVLSARSQSRTNPNKRANKSSAGKHSGFAQSGSGNSPQQQHSSSNQMTTSTGRIDGRRGPKRPRTILTTSQRRAFKNSFDMSQKPCRKVREALAKETGLSVRIVQVWFQNQRAKLKKIQRKQLPQVHQLASSPGALSSTSGSSAIPHHLHHSHHAHLHHAHQQQHLSPSGHMNPTNPNIEQSRAQVQIAQQQQHLQSAPDFMLNSGHIISGDALAGQQGLQRSQSSKGAGQQQRRRNESEGELSRSGSELEDDDDDDDEEDDEDDEDELDEEEELEEEEIEEEEEEMDEEEDGGRSAEVGVAKQEKAQLTTSNEQ